MLNRESKQYLYTVDAPSVIVVGLLFSGVTDK